LATLAPVTKAARRATAASRHLLYELAVQAPVRDVAWIRRWFRRAAGRPLRSLREDFCGTAALAAEFVRGGDDHRAVGVDASAATLRWARANVLPRLDEGQRRRLRLLHGDVRTVRTAPVDLTIAANFSYCVFHERPELLGYLRAVRRGLRRGGFVLLDAWGGGLTQRRFVERQRHRGFAHVWEQRAFDPITHRVDCRIHFELRGGAVLRDAFVYDWRTWSLPELQDLLREAGFDRVQVLMQDARSGAFVRRRRADADPTWLAFVAGRRGQR